MGLRTSRRVVCLAALAVATTACRRAPRDKAREELSAPADDTHERVALGVGIPLPPGDPGQNDLVLEVRADRAGRRISPLVYGVNDELRELERQRWGVIRLGGNRFTAYNWENNASNAGADWHFQNDSYLSDSDQPAAPVLHTIDGARRLGVPAIVTVSILDHVAADKLGGGDVRKSGPAYLSTRFKRNVARKAGELAPHPDVSDDAVHQDEFVAYLKAARPDARLLFSMDNEPDIWAHTHAEIHPDKVTYQELWRRNHSFAGMLKERWPDAEVLGFVSFGWGGMNTLQDAPDAQRGNFISWYLEQAQLAERREGRRLIDYLDVHWYPEATGDGARIVNEEKSAPLVVAREQAPRSLWDRGYREESWITKQLGGPIALVPWLKKKVSAHYPGTKLSFSEWNYGGGTHISGAIAVADVLGIFGREGVDLATYYPLGKNEPFAYAAFRVFRNYDGQGGEFGAVSVPADSPDVERLTAYASIAEEDTRRLTIVVINKASKELRAGLRLHHSALYSRAKVYELAGETPELVERPALQSADTNAFSLLTAPQSITVVVPMP